MFERFRYFVALLCTSLIVSCGKGGGSDDLVLVPESPAVLSAGDNSYKNFKQIGLSSAELPAFGDARAYAHFTGGAATDFFVAVLRYSLGSAASAAPSAFLFFKRQPDGSWEQDTSLLVSSDGCVHPRKAIVADFNLDGKPDIFVACHGYDAAPFPGERSKVVLSKSDGTYAISDAAPDVGFFHSASAADLNGDGYPDVVVADPHDERAVYVFLNRKDGTFQREIETRLPVSLGGKNYFTVELADVDGDGSLDLLVGGHEWEGANTRAFINPGNNIFEGAEEIEIPSVANEGVVLDFAATNTSGSRQLWVLRTSGGDGTFYQSRVLQRMNLAGRSSSVVVNERPARWLRWIVPNVEDGKNYIISDDKGDEFSYLY